MPSQSPVLYLRECGGKAGLLANASHRKLESMKNQCNSLRHALIDFDARKSLSQFDGARARARASARTLKRFLLRSAATDSDGITIHAR